MWFEEQHVEKAVHLAQSALLLRPDPEVYRFVTDIYLAVSNFKKASQVVSEWRAKLGSSPAAVSLQARCAYCCNDNDTLQALLTSPPTLSAFSGTALHIKWSR